MSTMKVAIVHDWLTTRGGAVNVAHVFHTMYPDAPVYTSSYNPEALPEFADADVRTTWIQKMPFRNKHMFYPLARQRAFENLDFSDYDVVISSSGSEAKGIVTGPNTLHINYCHAPTHYYWRNYEDYIKDPGFGALNPVMRVALKALVKRARKWDLKAAQRPDFLIVNSSFIGEEVKKYYDRDSVVIHPPVDTDRFKPDFKKKRSGFLVFGRQVAFKRLHLAIQACNELGLELTVAGDGPENQRLREIAGPTIKFETGVSHERAEELFNSADGFIFTAEDDFGIVVAESLAAGTPIVSFGVGGPRDIVEDGKTGVFFNEPTVDSLKQALQEFSKCDWDRKYIKKSAEAFSRKRFERQIREFVEQKYSEHKKQKAKQN